MAKAICISCGNHKEEPWRKCEQCGYDPSEDEDAMLRSVYLSSARFEEAGDKRRYELELDQVACMIARGEMLPFDDAELNRLRIEKRAVDAVPSRRVWCALARLFIPAMMLLGLLWLIWLTLRSLRH